MRNIFLVIALLMWFVFLYGENATDIPPDIAELFPTATRVAHDTDMPVIPVYQLGQLLGYVFESKILFMGFAGEPTMY